MTQDVTQNWNDSWVEAGEEDPFYFKALLGVTLGAYAGERTPPRGSGHARRVCGCSRSAVLAAC